MKQELSQRLIKDLENFDTISGVELQKSLVQWLDKEVPYYNWTGFYFMNDEKQQLEIGPYVGAYTDHTVIPYGRGICGQVAVSGKTFEVPDVHAQDNYLACSLATKRRLLYPFTKGKSHRSDRYRFTRTGPIYARGSHLLEAVANFVAQRL